MQNETLTPAAPTATEGDAQARPLPTSDSLLDRAYAQTRQALPRLTFIASQAAMAGLTFLPGDGFFPDFWGGGSGRGC